MRRMASAAHTPEGPMSAVPFGNRPSARLVFPLRRLVPGGCPSTNPFLVKPGQWSIILSITHGSRQYRRVRPEPRRTTSTRPQFHPQRPNEPDQGVEVALFRQPGARRIDAPVIDAKSVREGAVTHGQPSVLKQDMDFRRFAFRG